MAQNITATDRLLAQLNQTQLAQKDNPVYQVIKQLIQRVKDLESLLGASSNTNNTTTNIQQIINQINMGDGDSGDGGMGPPGIRGSDGATGATGAQGPPFPAFIFQDGEVEDVMPIPGPQGIQGVAGNTGAAGPSFPFMLPEPDMGEDPLMIPGRDGTSASSTQDWEGKIIGCAGDGNPNLMLATMGIGSISPTRTNIGTTNARCSYFKLKTAITVARIRWYGCAAIATSYHVAIYRASDDARISADNNVTTNNGQWDSVADSFTLNADTLYYAAVSVNATGATAGILAFGGNLTSASVGIIVAPPTGWNGNLDWDSNYVKSYAFANASVTSGVLPNPGNTPATIGSWSGGMPAIFCDNNSAA